LQILWDDSGTVFSVAWSPDGKRLATASWGETARVWDAATGKELLDLSGGARHVSDVVSRQRADDRRDWARHRFAGREYATSTTRPYREYFQLKRASGRQIGVPLCANNG